MATRGRGQWPRVVGANGHIMGIDGKSFLGIFCQKNLWVRSLEGADRGQGQGQGQGRGAGAGTGAEAGTWGRGRSRVGLSPAWRKLLWPTSRLSWGHPGSKVMSIENMEVKGGGPLRPVLRARAMRGALACGASASLPHTHSSPARVQHLVSSIATSGEGIKARVSTKGHAW